MARRAANKGKTTEPQILNRRARRDYHIDDTLEVGVALRGSEVKSVRDGKMSLAEGYVRAQEKPLGLFLHSVHIGEYQPATGINQHTPTRSRALLAHKREIRKLLLATQAKGATIIPLKAYFSHGRLKLLIGVARGKKHYDQREDVKKREADRDIRRAMSKRM